MPWKWEDPVLQGLSMSPHFLISVTLSPATSLPLLFLTLPLSLSSPASLLAHLTYHIRVRGKEQAISEKLSFGFCLKC